MAEQFPILIIIAPLFGALLIALLGFRFPKTCLPVVLLALAASVVAAVGTFLTVLETGPQTYNVSGWERQDKPTGSVAISIAPACWAVR